MNNEIKDMKKEIKVNPPKLRKNTVCWLCKKEIKKGSWCWNGHFFHNKCKEIDTKKRIKKYLTSQKGRGKNN